MSKIKYAILSMSLLLAAQGMFGIQAVQAQTQIDLSKPIEQMEGYAEDIVETADKPNWQTFQQKTANLRQLWQSNYPELLKKSDRTDLSTFELSLLDLEQAVHQRSTWQAAHSANTLTLTLIDFQKTLPPSKVPIAVAEMDYWGREVNLRSQTGMWGSVAVGAGQLNTLWQSLRSQVHLHNSPLAQQVDDSTGALILAVKQRSRKNIQKYTALILEQVDSLETTFIKS